MSLPNTVQSIRFGYGCGPRVVGQSSETLIKTLTKPSKTPPFHQNHNEPLFYSKIEDRSGHSQIDMRRVQREPPEKFSKKKLEIQRKLNAEKRNKKKREGRFDRGISERLASVKNLRSQSRSNKAYLKDLRNILGQSQSGTDPGKSSVSKVGLSSILIYLKIYFWIFKFNF